MNMASFFKNEAEKNGIFFYQKGGEIEVVAKNFSLAMSPDVAYVGLATGIIKDEKEKAVAGLIDAYSFFCENPHINTEEEEIKEMVIAQIKNAKKIL